jgi:hypothetical protein
MVGGAISSAMGGNFWQGFTSAAVAAGVSLAANEVAGEIEANNAASEGDDEYVQKGDFVYNTRYMDGDPGILLNDMTNGKLIFETMDLQGGMVQYSVDSSTAVVSSSLPGAQNGYMTSDVSWNPARNNSRFGPNGAYIQTNDYRFRVIHGGRPYQGPTLSGTTLPDPPLGPTKGCTRGYNSDVPSLGKMITSFQAAHPGEKVPFIRYGTPPGATHQNYTISPDSPMIRAILEGRLMVYPPSQQYHD